MSDSGVRGHQDFVFASGESVGAFLYHFELFGDCLNDLGSIQRSRCMV